VPRPTVSTPLGWHEVEAALASGRAGDLSFEPAAVVERVARVGDWFAPLARPAELPAVVR